VTLTLTSDDLESHIVMNVSLTLTNTTIWFVALLCFIVNIWMYERTYVRTDRQTFLLGLLGHLRRWPKNRNINIFAINPYVAVIQQIWLPQKSWQDKLTHTHTTVLLLFWNLSGTTRVSRYQKGKNHEGKTNLDLLEQEIVSGSGICWAICKSAPHPR